MYEKHTYKDCLAMTVFDSQGGAGNDCYTANIP